MFACFHGPQAAALAASFSPWVEHVDSTTAVIELTVGQTIQAAAGLLSGVTAVASTAETAILAARNLPGFTFIPPGDECRILGCLPIDCLPEAHSLHVALCAKRNDPEIFQTLDLWGIRTLADLARLPDDGLIARLGARGLRLQQLARGTLNRPLRPDIPASVYEMSAELDHPLELRDPLIFLIGRFLFELSARLKSQSLAAQALHLRLNRQDRVLRLPFPTRDVKFLIRLVEHSLETLPPEEPVEKVHLRIEPTEPRRVQHGLFTLAAPEPEKLELTLGKIRGLVGAENVLYPKVLDTHRPGVGPMQEPILSFRYFRPPLEVRFESLKPRILKIAGPWRSSGDWWRPDAWDRDEFDVYLSDGVLYRVVHEDRRWFMEGTYD